MSTGFCFALFVVSCRILGSKACSSFAAGKKATKDGSVLVSHSDDADPANDVRLIYVPAADHAPGSVRPIFYSGEDFPRYVGSSMGPGYLPNEDTSGYNVTEPTGFIDQVAHTFGYQSSGYGVINEHSVSVGESTCFAMFGTCGKGSSVACEPGREVGSALMSIDTLSYIAMERCRTSRDAVELMGDLAVRYGFYGPPDFSVGGGESLLVGDPDEAWVFHILSDPTGTSAIWTARRVPDTDVTMVANMFTIRVIDLNDTANFLSSPNILDVPKQRGWWKEGEPFDFTKMYSAGEYRHKYYSGRRMWRGLQLAAQSTNLPEEYDDIRYTPAFPWSVKPDKLVDHHDIISWHRDWYAGTKYDMTKGLQAGPFGSPDRFVTSSSVKGNWERSIAQYRTSEVYVQQLRHPVTGEPPGLASVSWYGAGPPHYAPFVPIPSGVSRSVGPLQIGVPYKLQMESMNWATRKVMDVCQIRWDKMHAAVESAQRAVEGQGDEALEMLRGAGGELGAEAINDAIEKHAWRVLWHWNDLLKQLVFNFTDNTRMEDNTAMGYPDAWLEGSGWANGPPDAPVQDQCPPMCTQRTAGMDVLV